MDSKSLLNKFSTTLKVQNEGSLRIYLYGYLSEIILSKEIFKNNKDLSDYFDSLNITHKRYVYASRTLVVAKTIRIIQKMELSDLKQLRDQTLNFLSLKLDIDSKEIKKKYNNAKLIDDDYVKTIVSKYRRSDG